MFGFSKSGANAYADISIKTGVVAASPHKLIMMLFEGALVSIAMAVKHTGNGEIAAKGEAISKAQNIITNGLRASLNFKDGGEIAANLEALYDYMNRRLVSAHAQNSIDMLEEVHTLLAQLKDAWAAIDPSINPADMGQQVNNMNQQIQAKG